MIKRLRTRILIRIGVTLTLLVILSVMFFGIIQTSDGLNSGMQYKIIRPIYVMGVYNSLNNRKISKTTARAYLHSTRYYQKSQVAFQNEVPAGTIMTIIEPAPRVWHLPFLANRYVVHLEPDFSNGLEVLLELNRGMDGDLDGLNSELFERLN